MKFDIRNRHTSEVQFTADIYCPDDAGDAVKKGLAVIWAIKNRASLNNASLNNASLDGASLNNASLYGASLDGASLNNASLDGASLNNASLNNANLNNANLNNANLNNASLNNANLNNASLNNANLDGASLNRVSGLNDWIKCMQIDTYAIAYTADVIQIGCQRHTHAEWASFSEAQIRAMDGLKARNWWRKWKEPLFQSIALAPAKPTGFVEEAAE